MNLGCDKMKVDFHMHTNNSDGAYSYERLINECIKNDIRFIAITDHNTFTPCYTLPKGIKVVNGMELDVRYKNYTLHMLLYGFNENSKMLKEYFKRSRRHEIYRFHRYLDLIEDTYHLNIDKKFVREFIKNNNYFDTVRMNKLLVQYHICNGPKESFGKYTHILPPNKRYRIKMEEFIKIVDDSNGIMSLAHPLKYNHDIKKTKEIILDLKEEYHLQVIEAINNHQTKEEEKELIDFCKRNKLLISGGSDAHYAFGENNKKLVGMVLDHKLIDDDLNFLKLLKNDNKLD